MSTKMSKEDFIAALKSKGALSDAEISKINGGTFDLEKSYIPFEIECPYCHNKKGNGIRLMPGAGNKTGEVMCGNENCQNKDRTFFVIDGEVPKLCDFFE